MVIMNAAGVSYRGHQKPHSRALLSKFMLDILIHINTPNVKCIATNLYKYPTLAVVGRGVVDIDGILARGGVYGPAGSRRKPKNSVGLADSAT